ncbi:MAG TPA: PTS sugar transporter subunit IIA [Planctomycetota bacterium]|jgi:mannitol/fructose-specific phosphotransferase system IIA component (Ntr-type)|nr:PTS sugar transporter subunit IIA [Planctomycetota bacterium]
MRGFWDLFDPCAVLLDLQAGDRDGVFAELLGALVAARRLTRKEGERALALFRKREELGTTGIGGGIAIPHVKIPGLARVAAALGLSRAGVDYRSVDGERVRAIFLIARPEAEEEEHLRFLRWVSGLARHRDFLRFALSAKSADELRALLQELGEGPG